MGEEKVYPHFKENKYGIFEWGYYIFDSHSRNRLRQSNESGYSILLQFVSIEHVLNFSTIYLINNQLQHVYENQFVFFLQVERSAKGNAV